MLGNIKHASSDRLSSRVGVKIKTSITGGGGGGGGKDSNRCREYASIKMEGSVL